MSIRGIVFQLPSSFADRAFLGIRYWSWAPAGEEWTVQTILGINQGALGVVPWTPAGIKSAPSACALSLLNIMPYLFNPASVRTAYVVGGASVATWNAGAQTLVPATDTNHMDQTVGCEALGLEGTDDATTVFMSGVTGCRDDGRRVYAGTCGLGRVRMVD